ncbi:ABC transporter ATP-binding protein [Lysinibacillus telephonicus]|uniref:ABC transporter ATP-binding protein n=1 Tax=Lysinibacillus telephonicus TaxID=1714840 RepID=UPI0031FD103B
MSLKIQNVSKKFKDFQAINDVSFTVETGEIVSILGPSGCGKSTLMQIVAGLQTLDSGQVTLNGNVISSVKHIVPPEKRGINMVFQDYALWPHMTVLQNIFYGSKIRKEDKFELLKKQNFLFNLLQLNGLENRYPSELSGGQQQRVAIARALSTNPSLLLMDEPLSNLDMQLRFEMRTELSYLLRQFGTTVLHVTHDPLEAYSLADRILILREGRIEQFGTPEEVRQNPASLWVAGLLGMTNRITATQLTETTAKVGESIISGIGQLSMSSDAVIVVDSDALRILKHMEDSNNANKIDAKVTHVIYEGQKWRIILQTAGGRISALSKERFEVNQAVKVAFEPQQTFLFSKATSFGNNMGVLK